MTCKLKCTIVKTILSWNLAFKSTCKWNATLNDLQCIFKMLVWSTIWKIQFRTAILWNAIFYTGENCLPGAFTFWSRQREEPSFAVYSHTATANFFILVKIASPARQIPFHHISARFLLSSYFSYGRRTKYACFFL